MPDPNKRALARAAIEHVVDSNANEATPNPMSGYVPLHIPNDTSPLTNLQAKGYNVAIPANAPAVTVSGYGEMPPLEQPVNPIPSGYVPLHISDDTPPLTNLQAKGYSIAIPANLPAPVSLGYSASPVVETAVNGYDKSPAVETQVTDISSGYVSPHMEAPNISPTEEPSALGYSEIELNAPVLNTPTGYVSPTSNPASGYDQILRTNDDPSGGPAYVETLSTNNNAPAIGTANPALATGLRGKQLGDKYVGEEKGEGWRKNMPPHGGKQLVTEHFSEKKKKQSKVEFDTEGQAVNANGTLDGKQGFVVDPTTGNMHVFKEGDNRTVGDKIFMTHHSSPLGGKEAAGAGMVTFNDGQITNITDQSGHYKPEAEFTFQTVQHLNSANEANNGQSPLLSNAVNTSGRAEASLSPELKKLVVHLEKIKSEVKDLRDKDPNADVGNREEQARQIRDALVKAHVDLAYNKEATVTLLGKTGMLTDDEYRPMFQEYRAVTQDTSATDIEKATALQKLKDDVNRASALKQLQAPLGEAEYARLLLIKRPKAEGAPEGKTSEGAIEQAMRERNIEPGSEGAAKRLKAALGAEALAKIKDDEAQITQLSAQYGVVAIDTEFEHGPERAGFEIGTKTAATLTTQQFLQTGGNEAQIRTKQRLMSEIQPDKTMPGPKVSLKPTPPVDPEKQKIDPKKEMQGADASTETLDTPDGSAKAQPSHPAASQLLKKLNVDLASQKAILEKALEKLDGEIAAAEQPDSYTGIVNTASVAPLKEQKAALRKELDEILTEKARSDGASKKGGSNANPPLTNPGKPGTGGHAPPAPSIRTAAELKMDQQWFRDQAAAKKEAEQAARMQSEKNVGSDAERLEVISILVRGKIKEMIAAGLSSTEIHRKLHDEERVSHEDIDKLGFPG